METIDTPMGTMEVEVVGSRRAQGVVTVPHPTAKSVYEFRVFVEFNSHDDAFHADRQVYKRKQGGKGDWQYFYEDRKNFPGMKDRIKTEVAPRLIEWANANRERSRANAITSVLEQIREKERELDLLKRRLATLRG